MPASGRFAAVAIRNTANASSARRSFAIAQPTILRLKRSMSQMEPFLIGIDVRDVAR